MSVGIPTVRVTLDIESFYDREVSLSKMTPLQYIMDPRCQIIGASLRVDNHPIGLGSGAERRPFSRKAMWFNGRQLPEVFAKIPWSQVTLVSHNIGFDGAVLAWRYGHVPALYVDTLGLSRAHLFPYTGSASLGKVSDYLGLPPKDSDALANALGWTLEMLEHDESVGGTRYPRYRKYCCIDTDNCESIVNRLVPFTPPEEIILADMVARMAIQPQFSLNRNVLVTHLAKVKADKARLVETLVNKGIIEVPEVGSENKPPQLMSDTKLAEILTNLGVDPPMKISAATGKVGYAFAKTDKAFTALLEHEDPDVQIVAAARLGVKTTLEESRTERFIGCADVRWQHAAMPAMLPQGLAARFPMPFPLKFSGAHTHRLSGDWKLNLQNLGRESSLRRALEAPPGYSVVSADASQIEARIVCWLAGAAKPLHDFRTKSDPYSNIASMIFGYPVSKATHPKERFVGKTCIAEKTLVYTDHGLIPIELVTRGMRVWDGSEWVAHAGVIPTGTKPTLNLCGVWLTPDHRVLCGEEWQPASSLVRDERFRSQALGTAAASLSSLVISLESETGSLHCSSPAIAGPQTSIELTPAISAYSPALDAPAAPGACRHNTEKTIGATPTYAPMTRIGLGFLTESLPPFSDAPTRTLPHGGIMGGAVSVSTPHGSLIGASACDTYSPCQGGTSQNSNLIESTLTKDMSQEICALYPEAQTCQTNDRSQLCNSESLSWKKTYDVSNAGLRHRFMIHTDAGPMIVHNCVLGLGFGMGDRRFQVTCWNQGKVVIDDQISKKAVKTYREDYAPEVKTYWGRMEYMLDNMIIGNDIQLGPIRSAGKRILLPSGLMLHYPNLRKEPRPAPWDPTQAVQQFVFDYGNEVVTLFGGKATENVVQALARIATMNVAYRIRMNYGSQFPLAGQVHDQLAYVVPTQYAQWFLDNVLIPEMRAPLPWCVDLPLDAEGGVGANFADAK